MEEAPYFEDLAEGPHVGAAYWVKAADSVRIRIGVWPEGGAGTVFMYCGRTEFAEKYGVTARELGARGYASLGIDWRGQGLSDRLADNPMLGHVDRFLDYQKDCDAALDLAEALGLPKPWLMLGHSMGGAIGLRHLLRSHPFAAAAFSAPMWGIQISPFLKPIALPLARTLDILGFGERFAPSTSEDSYVADGEFAGNQLTTYEPMWDYMQRQARADPRLKLGGPSVRWLAESLAEVRALQSVPRPGLPVYTGIGELERIVHIPSVEEMMHDWPDGDFQIIQNSEHEILMEGPDIRSTFYDRAEKAFAKGMA